MNQRLHTAVLLNIVTVIGQLDHYFFHGTCIILRTRPLTAITAQLSCSAVQAHVQGFDVQ